MLARPALGALTAIPAATIAFVQVTRQNPPAPWVADALFWGVLAIGAVLMTFAPTLRAAVVVTLTALGTQLLLVPLAVLVGSGIAVSGAISGFAPRGTAEAAGGALAMGLVGALGASFGVMLAIACQSLGLICYALAATVVFWRPTARAADPGAPSPSTAPSLTAARVEPRLR
jgi:hypothetical protein